MPKAVDECVKKRLANPDFQAPEGSDKNRKEFAWALCQTLYKKGKLKGMTVEIEGKEYRSLDDVHWYPVGEANVAGFSLQPVTDADMERLNLLLGAETDKSEILKFSNAFLAREEVNKNKDELSASNLEDIAKTLPLKAIDHEHREQEIVGLFIEGRVRDDGVITDGLIYARRRPDVAMGLMNGELKLSIEADADGAECSMCGEIFSSQKEYCSHLQTRLQGSGATRKFPGSMWALGGGVTKNPAGSDTDVPTDSIVMIASQIEVEGDDGTDGVVVPESKKPEVKGGAGMEELEKVQTELKEKVEALEALEGEKDALVTERDELKAQLEAAEGERETLKAQLENETKAHKREVELMTLLSPEVIAEKRDVLAGMDDEAFALFVESLKGDEKLKAGILVGHVPPVSEEKPPESGDKDPKWVS